MPPPQAQVEDVCNRALRAAGIPRQVSWIYEGSAASRALLEVYAQRLRGLLRAANWSFARKRAPIQLLGDSTLENPTVSSFVEPPWRYAYAWPIDGVRVRWLPWSQEQPSALAPPLMTGLSVQQTGQFPRDRPARFLATTSDQYPILVGEQPPGSWPSPVEGAGPISRRIILTNVLDAQLVYTYLCLDISVWDELFTQAMVATLASDVLPVLKPGDVAERDRQIMLAKNAIKEARIASHQEAGFPQSINHVPDWIKARHTGYSGYWTWSGGDWGMGMGPGVSSYGWDTIGFADGSVF